MDRHLNLTDKFPPTKRLFFSYIHSQNKRKCVTHFYDMPRGICIITHKKDERKTD